MKKYLQKLRDNPEVYARLMQAAINYICDTAREKLVCTGRSPTRLEFEKLIVEADLKISYCDLDSLAEAIVEDGFMSREK